jgi:hypothetical protein
MEFNWSDAWNHALKYVAYIMFYLEESKFSLPLEDAMKE